MAFVCLVSVSSLVVAPWLAGPAGDETVTPTEPASASAIVLDAFKMKPLGLVGVINALAHILVSTSTVVALPLSRPDDVVGGLSEEQLTSRCHGHGQHQRVFNVLLYQREPCIGDAPSTNETPRPLVLLFDRTASEDEALEHESSPASTSDGEVVERRFVKPIGRFLKNLSFEDRLGLGGAIAGLLTFYPYAIASVRSHRPLFVFLGGQGRIWC